VTKAKKVIQIKAGRGVSQDPEAVPPPLQAKDLTENSYYNPHKMTKCG
jgi:hypothetical protein